MKALDALLALIDTITKLAAWAAAALLAALFLLGLAEIALRNLAAVSLPFAVEYAGYMTAAVLLLGSGWCLRTGGHIRVTLLAQRVRPETAWALDMAASLFGLAIAGYFALALIGYAAEMMALGTRSYYPSQTPLAWPQLVLAAGPAVLALAFLARLIRLARGEAPETAMEAEPFRSRNDAEAGP